MGMTLRTASAAVGILMACAAGQAQMRGARMARTAPVVTRSAAPRVVVHSAVPARTIAVTRVPMTTQSRNGQITIINNVNSTPLVTPQVFDADDFPVPGLGFDFAHLAAINAGRHHRRFRGTTFATFGGFPFVEFPFFSDSSGVAPVQAAPPQVIIVQQPVPQQAEDDEAEVTPRRSRSRRFYSAPAPEAPADAAPGRAADEYVLVRRDGGLLFAVAFSLQGGQLNYVTREGLRRTVALAAIDAEATEQMNEQRGMTVRLPA